MNPHNPHDPQHPYNPQYPPYPGPGHGQGPDGPAPEPREMPQDVVTGFWLWTAALPLSLIGYVINLLTTPEREVSGYAYAVSGLMLFIIAVLVATFLVLLGTWFLLRIAGPDRRPLAEAGYVLSMAAAALARVPVRVHTFTGLIFPYRKGPSSSCSSRWTA